MVFQRFQFKFKHLVYNVYMMLAFGEIEILLNIFTFCILQSVRKPLGFSPPRSLTPCPVTSLTSVRG